METNNKLKSFIKTTIKECLNENNMNTEVNDIDTLISMLQNIKTKFGNIQIMRESEGIIGLEQI